MPTFIRPVQGAWISDDFDKHRARGSVNPGTDYAVPRGTLVVMPAAGRIVLADGDPGGAAGRCLGIDFDNGWGADLLHLDSLLVGVGWYREGHPIARSGGSAYGRNDGVGNHVHMSLRTRHGAHLMNAGNVDPEKYMRPTEPWYDAKQLQTRLNVWAPVDGAALLTVDGVLGPLSKARIRDFQAKHGLVVDGKVGPATWAILSQDPPKPVPEPEPVPEPAPEPEPDPEPTAPPEDEHDEPDPEWPGEPDLPIEPEPEPPTKSGNLIGLIVTAILAAIAALIAILGGGGQ